MDTQLLQLSQLLKAHKLSLTQPRRILFELLLKNEPLTVAEVLQATKGRIDRASIYRTIGLFENLGIIQRLQIGWKYKLELSNNFQPHHHHLSCLQCGSIMALAEDTIIEDRMEMLSRDYGFTITDHQLEIRGICKSCQA